MTIQIRRLHLSLIWAQAFSLNMTNPLLGNRVAYIEQFEKAQLGTSELSLPWRPKEEQHFWERYLEIRHKRLRSVTGPKAWKHMVPLRAPDLVKFETPSGLSIDMEGLLYPHGAGIIAKVCLAEELSLYDMVDKAVQVRNGKYKTIWHKKVTSKSTDTAHSTEETLNLTLDRAAARMLDWLFLCALGKGVEPREMDKPFTIATMIDGSGVSLEDTYEPGSQVHRAMEGLCILNKYWRTKKLRDLDKCTEFAFKDRNDVASCHMVYALERNRAIWFPGNFSEHQEDGLPNPKNTCYHRNLEFASVQTYVLLDLVQQTYNLLQTHAKLKLPPEVNRFVDMAVDILGRHYGYADGAYQSWSVRQQIVSKRKFVNKVRIECGKDRLHLNSA